MFKDKKEINLAQNLYDLLKKDNNGITSDLLKNGIYSIFRIENEFDTLKLHEQFKTFYFNKMSHSNSSFSVPQYSHTPKLNANSIKLAERSRERRKQLLKEFHDGKSYKPSIEDLLIITQKEREEQLKAKREAQTVIESKNCTFQPTTNEKGSNSRNKCISLYNLSQLNKSPHCKTIEQVENEKSKSELLFTPISYR